MKTIILVGGSGERFWPLSTAKTPKQFLKLFGEKTLLRQTFERLLYKANPQDIYIVTNRIYEQPTRSELPEIPKDNVLLEPLRKNTAPACTFASLKFDTNETIFIVPADHYIPQVENFWHCIEIAQEFVENHEGMITFGIVPTRVETAYGYIQSNEQIQENIFKVTKFHEKPDYNTALFYIQQSNYFWNSGMFMCKNGYFIQQMKKHAPQIIEPFLKDTDIETIYQKVPSISIDYALMEKIDQIYMVKSDFIWSDVGNFKSLKDLGVQNSNCTVLENSKNVFVKTSKPTIVIGIDNAVIIESENGLLVCNINQLDKLRDTLKKLNQE